MALLAHKSYASVRPGEYKVYGGALTSKKACWKRILRSFPLKASGSWERSA